MARVSVSCSVDDEHLPSIGAVAEALRERGLDVAQVLDGVGVITGEVADDRRGALQEVPGVLSVDADLPVQLPPPDSPVQ